MAHYQFAEMNTIPPWLYSIRRACSGTVEKDFIISRTKHYPYCNLHYVVSGRMKVNYEDKTYTVGQGECFLLPSFESHAYAVPGNNKVELQWIEFSGADTLAIVKRIIKMNGSPVIHITEDQRKLFREQLFGCAREASIYKKSSHLYGLFSGNNK